MQDESINIQPSATEISTTAAEQPVFVKVYPYTNFSYDTGFADGVLRLGAMPHYETFSEHLEKKELAEALLERCRKELSRVDTELQRIRLRTLDRFSAIFEKEENIRFVETRLKEVLQQREDLIQNIQKIQQKHELIEPEYSWLVAIIMLSAGFLFIVADVLITQGIMEQALSMRPYEAWIIAVSISLTAFAVKPAIDRIFERPLWIQKKVLRNNILMIVLSILIIFMLGCLGYFRSEAYYVMINYGLDNNDPAIINRWKELIISPSIICIFTIASILFAVVGALCLSIGFRSAELHSKRIMLIYYKGRIQERLLKQKEARIFELREIEAKYRKELREAQKEIELMPSQMNLEMRLAGLKSEEKDLMTLIAEANATAQSAWYREGASRGERFNVSGELYVSPIRTERWVVPEAVQGPYQGRIRPGGNKSNNSNASQEMKKDTSGRPDDYLYQQIRNAIALHDNKINKRTFTNGTQS